MNAIAASNFLPDPALELLDAGASASGLSRTRPNFLGMPQVESSESAPCLPWLPATSPPVHTWEIQPDASGGTADGYSQTAGSWSFLSDPSLSIEDKLAAFMATVQKKTDDDLTQKMNDYKAKYAAAANQDQGFFGFLSSVMDSIFPKGTILNKALGGLTSLIGDGLKTLTGPVLAGLATAIGLPSLAPAALKAGASLGKAIGDALGLGSSSSSSSTKSTTSSGSKTTSSTTTGEAGSPDERLAMLEIQRLVEKQNQMFTLVSNVLKSINDTAMGTINNIR